MNELITLLYTLGFVVLLVFVSMLLFGDWIERWRR